MVKNGVEGLELEENGLEDEGVLIPPELVEHMQIVVQTNGSEYRKALMSVLMSTGIKRRRSERIKKSRVHVNQERAEEESLNYNGVLGGEMANCVQVKHYDEEDDDVQTYQKRKRVRVLLPQRMRELEEIESMETIPDSTEQERVEDVEKHGEVQVASSHVNQERVEDESADSDEILGDELTNSAQIETEECREEGADDVGESDEEEVDQERVEDEPVRDNGIPGNSIDGGLEESDEEAADNDGLYDNRTNPGSKENKSKLLECSICEISFTRNNNLKKHKKTAHGDLAKKYPCTICKKEFKIYGLKDHMNKIHSSKSYHCPQCDHVAPYAARLKTHVQSVHEGIRYPCSHCDYQATKNSDLRKHIRYVHDGVRDFPCSQCDHKAKRKHEFQKHVARRH